ncbi:MAG: NAD(P)-binding domain-containing protein [Saprospiraceae bacterium]|nr:NAD(P)-binding domain-containing protein [Saprospiraceae bacterium]
MKKIGILGSGMVAKTLGAGFIKHGYEVMLGTSDASKLADWQTKNDSKIGSFSEAAAFGEMVVLAVKGIHAESALQRAGLDNLAGKTILDATNPIDESRGPVNGVLPFFTDLNQSLMERLQVVAPSANFVKCFSCVGNHLMVDPQLPGGPPSMFICGNSDGAKQEATALLHQIGWEVEDMGAAEAARAIEPLCILWCIPGFKENKWGHAFKLLKP